MGSISFLLPDPIPPAAEAMLRNACFSTGYDMAPLPGEVAIQGGLLTIVRNLTDSGYLLIPWPVGQFGTIVNTSSTLRESEQPYRLLIELARGKLNQVRMQTAEWEGVGLRLPDGYQESLGDTTRQFTRALLGPSSAECDALATRVLERAFTLGDALSREFIAQMFDTRHHEEGLLDSRLGARTVLPVGAVVPEYARSFNAVQVAFRWRDLEQLESHYDWTESDRAVAAARAADLPITGGPVIDLAADMLPAWTEEWISDLPTIAAFMCDFLETVITRYKDDIRRWVICSGFNHSDAYGLDDDSRLRLAFRLFEAAAQIDPNLELVLSVAQPWGDYLVNENQTISPLTFPDDMIRAGLRVSAVEFEIRNGVVPRGSFPRDLLDSYRLINLYGLLGVPLEILLSAPTGSQPDPMSRAGQTLWAPAWPVGPTPEGQAEWGASFAALALCTSHVRAVTWDHWSDGEPHLTPSGGLIDANGQPRPLLSRLRTLRTSHSADPAPELPNETHQAFGFWTRTRALFNPDQHSFRAIVEKAMSVRAIGRLERRIGQ